MLFTPYWHGLERMRSSESDRDGTTTHDLLVQGARYGLTRQRDDGSFPPGRNYTYDEPETPVRTTSNWLETLTQAYDITGDTEFADAANRAVDYLLGTDVRPHGFTFYCRDADSKDKCNGLVGQVSPIRALVRASRTLGRDDARRTAEEVFLLHPFSEELGLWERVEIDGQRLSFDRTLNHQIIFAVAGAFLAPELEEAENQTVRFLHSLRRNMHTHSDGVIKHYVRPPIGQVIRSVLQAPRRYDMLVNELVFHYYSRSPKRKAKERGYQVVNLVALSVIKERFPEHPFWDSPVLSDALEFLRANERELIDGIRTEHGSPIQGISIAKIRHRFEGTPIQELEGLISEELTENPERGRTFDIDEVDEHTQSALVSTFVDMPNLKVR